MPIHVDGSGQPLPLPESTSSPTLRVPAGNCREEAVLKGRNMGSPAVVGVSILYTPLLPLSLLVARTSLLSSQMAVLMLAFFPLHILPTPHFSTRLPYPSSLRPLDSSPWRSGPPQKTSSTPVSRSTPLPFPQFSQSSPHQLPALASLPCPSPILPSLPALLASLTLFLFTFVTSRSRLYHFLSITYLASPVTICLYVRLSSIWKLRW